VGESGALVSTDHYAPAAGANRGDLVEEVDVTNIYSEFITLNPRIHQMYLLIISNPRPNPKIQFELIPRLTEDFVTFVLNSDQLTHSWMRDFTRDSKTEDWDLINSEGKTIEVKSTKSEDEFINNRVRTNTDKQQESLILKLLMGKRGFEKLKFISYENGNWNNVTDSVLMS
jgi:hypothetical protein